MTDLELMELAAKAAGIAVHRGRAWQSDILFREIPRPSSPLVANVEWNPLTDDGDALRLAVKLALTVQAACSDEYGRMYTRVDHWPNTGGQAIVSVDEFGDDPCAATRRAIVRAAAEIGRQIGDKNE